MLPAGNTDVASALCWDDRFATHDMGRGGLYLPVEGLIEDDLHVDNDRAHRHGRGT